MMQAKDIADEVMIDAIQKTRGRNNVAIWSTIWDIQGELPQFPKKVVIAKLRSMVKRKLINGCVCGCRGDFEVLER